MAWTAPRTWVASEIVTASNMNTHVRDNDIELRAGGVAIASQAALDFVYASSASQLARLAKGAGHAFVRMNAAADGYEFIAPPQVVQGLCNTPTAQIFSTWTDTGLTATITPVSATSKILVHISLMWAAVYSGSHTIGLARLMRDATPSGTIASVNSNWSAGIPSTYIALTAPATTSAVVYKVQIIGADASGPYVMAQPGSEYSQIVLQEIYV